jgi:hypothetical protein
MDAENRMRRMVPPRSIGRVVASDQGERKES